MYIDCVCVYTCILEIKILNYYLTSFRMPSSRLIMDLATEIVSQVQVIKEIISDLSFFFNLRLTGMGKLQEGITNRKSKPCNYLKVLKSYLSNTYNSLVLKLNFYFRKT